LHFSAERDLLRLKYRLFLRARTEKGRQEFAGPSREMKVTGLSRSPFERSAAARLTSIESGRLGGQFGAGRFHRPHIHIEQGVALVAIVLVLFPQLDDFLEDLHIKTLTLGL
jgi:hypothetical protein